MKLHVFLVHAPLRLRARRCSAAATTLSVAVAVGVPVPSHAADVATDAVVGMASEPEPDAEAIVAEAVARFQAKEYEAAVELFEEAYALSPEPNYLFNIGRVYEQAGELEKAVEYYERFVQLPEVEIGAREVALDRLRVLRGVLEETAQKQTGAEPAPQPPPEPVTEPEPEREPEPEPEPKGMRIAGFVVLGAGVGLVGGGGAAAGLALQRKSELDTLVTLEERDRTVAKGKRNALTADILFGVGGAAIAAGAILVALSYTKARKAGGRAAVAPAISAHGLGLAAEVHF